MSLPIDLTADQRSLSNDFAPLFVFAPNSRCGSTLLQRLFNSSREILIYGEDLYFMQSLRSSLTLLLDAKCGGSGWQEAKNGNFEFWSNDLLPDPHEYARSAESNLNRTVRYHAKEARSLGAPRWGLKLPLAEIDYYPAIRHFLPQAGIVFLVRSPLMAAASAKARRFINDHYELERFARLWAQNVRQYMPRVQSEPAVVQLFRYEDLLSEPSRTVERLSAFSGIQRFDRKVLAKKINCPGVNGNGSSQSGYVESIPLTKAEEEIVLRCAEREMKWLGYLESNKSRSDSPHKHISSPAVVAFPKPRNQSTAGSYAAATHDANE